MPSDDLSAAAERYGVSLIAFVLRWLEFTTRRSMLVISYDGFILWARASAPAFMSGLFIRSKNVAPVEVPSASLLGRADLAVTKSRFTRTSTTNHSQFCISAATRACSGVSARPTSQMRSTGSTQSCMTGLAHLGHESKYAPTMTRQRKEPCP